MYSTPPPHSPPKKKVNMEDYWPEEGSITTLPPPKLSFNWILLRLLAAASSTVWIYPPYVDLFVKLSPLELNGTVCVAMSDTIRLIIL